MDWQDINTAPDDGTKIDLLVDVAGELVRMIDAHWKPGEFECLGIVYDGRWVQDDGRWTDHDSAHYWMPAPEMPKA